MSLLKRPKISLSAVLYKYNINTAKTGGHLYEKEFDGISIYP